MNDQATTGLRLQAQHTVLNFADSTEVVLTVGLRCLADPLLRHAPPTPLELEQAIDRVEDALASSRLPRAERGDLETRDPLLRAWLAAGRPPGADRRLSADGVEAVFQRLASASLGHPAAWRGLPQGPDAAAALLILRECLHHLGFAGVRWVDD